MRSRTVAVVLLALAASSCARTRVAAPVLDRFPALEQEVEFWHALSEKAFVCNDDALHGLLLLEADLPEGLTYEDRWEAALERGWVEDETPLPGREAVRYGLVARAACRILGIRGGIGMRLFGASGRRCARELAFQDLAPLRSPWQALTGPEYLDLVSRMERRQEDVHP